MNIVARRTTVLAVAIVSVGMLCAAASAQGTATGSLPRIYVFTQVAGPGRPAPADQGPREESVRDLRESLRKKPKLLEVVGASARADVTIEVLSREAPSTTQDIVTVRLRVVGRDYSRQFQGESRNWKDAAAMLADVIARWVNETYDTPPLNR
jgi:hypothetical protein